MQEYIKQRYKEKWEPDQAENKVKMSNSQVKLNWRRWLV